MSLGILGLSELRSKDSGNMEDDDYARVCSGRKEDARGVGIKI